MAKKKKCPKCPPKGAPAWMNTYGDMITQIMAFFVLLFSFSTLNAAKFEKFAASLEITLSGKPASILTGGKTMQEQPLLSPYSGIKKEILKITNDPRYKGKITIERRENGWAIILSNLVLFKPGTDILSQDAKNILKNIGVLILEHTTNEVEIDGFTNDIPLPKNSKYESNWYLSAARATAVAEYYTKYLKAEREQERWRDIQEKTFDPNYFYSPDRFTPIGMGTKAIRAKILILKANRDSAISQVQSSSLTPYEKQKKINEINLKYQKDLRDLRNKFRRIDIIILDSRYRRW
jgi:chemotaxis protein MotB